MFLKDGNMMKTERDKGGVGREGERDRDRNRQTDRRWRWTGGQIDFVLCVTMLSSTLVWQSSLGNVSQKTDILKT